MDVCVRVTHEDLEQIGMDVEQLSQAVASKLESGLEDENGTVYLSGVRVIVEVRAPQDGQPKVYSNKLSAEQNKACQRMQAVSGLPPVGLQKLEAGVLSPKEFWRLNLVTVHDINATVQNIDFAAD